MNQFIVDTLAFNGADVFFVFVLVAGLAAVVAVYSVLFSRWWRS